MWDRRVVRGNTYAAMIIPNIEQNSNVVQSSTKKINKNKE